MRAGALAAVVARGRRLGAAAVLVVGGLRGWVGADDGRPHRRRPDVAADRARSGRPGRRAAARQRLRSRRRSTPAARRASSRSTPTSPNGQRAQGSGFIVSEEGHVLTNSHVVTTPAAEGSTVQGRRPDLRRLRRRRPDPRLDRRLGPLQRHRASSRSIRRDHAVSPVPLGDSSRVVVGEPVAAIGSPFGQESSLAVGVVSATQRSIDVAHLRLRRLRCDPDRRADQPRQLGRPAARRPRPRDRDQRPDPLRLRATPKASASRSRSTRPAVRCSS